MDLKQGLLNITPREKSGATTASRYDFQKNWALSELLKKHAGVDDYCFVFEHHEDVLILNSSDNPTQIQFYQIKTKKTKHWLLSGLLHRKGDSEEKTLSVLAKLLQNLVNYPENTDSLNLVSNAGFMLDLTGAKSSDESLSKNKICAVELTQECYKKIIDQVKEELGQTADIPFGKITHFQVCDLSLEDHVKHTRGKLDDFLEQKFPGRKFANGAIYRTLFDEVKRRNNADVPADDFQVYLNTKAISRKSFEKILLEIGVKADLDEAWKTVEQRLNQEGIPFPRLVKIGKEWRRYEIDKMDLTNSLVQKLRSAASKAIADLNQPPAKIIDLLEQAFFNCEKQIISELRIVGRDYVDAVILMEYMLLV